MDTFAEQIVTKKKGVREYFLIAFTLIAAALILAATVYFILLIWIIVPVILFGVGFGVWWIVTSQNVEYEYCVTNGDIDIDCIVARRRRKRIVSVRSPKIESVGRYRAAEWQNRQIDCVIYATDTPQNPANRYFTYRSKKRGHTLVVFCPDERLSAAFAEGMSRPMQNDWNRE